MPRRPKPHPFEQAVVDIGGYLADVERRVAAGEEDPAAIRAELERVVPGIFKMRFALAKPAKASTRPRAKRPRKIKPA